MTQPRTYLSAAIAGLSLSFGGAQAATLVAHYDFNEAAGSTTLRNSAGSADGVVRDVTFVPSGIGGAYDFGNSGRFNGSTSHVAWEPVPDSFELGNDDFTITGWIKAEDNTLAGINRPVFGNVDYSQGGWQFDIGREDRSYRDKLYFTMGGVNAGDTQVFSDAPVADGEWHWVALIHESGSLTMYVDGVLQADTGSVTGNQTATEPDEENAYFGRNNDNASDYYEGELDEWRIYTGVLTGTLDGDTLIDGELYDFWQQGVPEPASLSLLTLGALSMLRRNR